MTAPSMRTLIEMVEPTISEETIAKWSAEIDAWKPPRNLKAPRPEDVDMFRKVREVIRHGEGGGGMCHFVSEWIENHYGWERCSGTYLAPNGDIICGGGHLWNKLPDGSILDATADHFAEGHDIRIISPDDPEYARYDYEWGQDYNPTLSYYNHPTHPGTRPASAYTGEEDYDAQARIETERGRNWADTDHEGRQRYARQQAAYDAAWKARHKG